MSAYYGKNLDPNRTNRSRGGFNAERQIIKLTNNPSTIAENQTLEIRFPNLSKNDVIVPGSVYLSFALSVTNGNPVNNIIRNIIKGIDIVIEGNTILSINDSNILYSYMDSWIPESVRRKKSFLTGTRDLTSSMTKKTLQLRLGIETEGDDSEKTLSKVYGSRFKIPLDFEMLTTAMPFNQYGLNERFSYILTFNNKGKFIKSPTSNGTYSVSDIQLEFEKVNSISLSNEVRNAYDMDFSVMFDRILRHRAIQVKSTDTKWNWSFASPVKSLRGILLLGKKKTNIADWTCKSGHFWNLCVKKVSVTIEGIPNQLFSNGILPTDIYEECERFLSGMYKEERSIDNTVKKLSLSGVDPIDFFDKKYAVWLDFRSTQDNFLHGSGRKIVSVSEGISVEIEREADTKTFDGTIYAFMFMDGLLQIVNKKVERVIF